MRFGYCPRPKARINPGGCPTFWSLHLIGSYWSGESALKLVFTLFELYTCVVGQSAVVNQSRITNGLELAKYRQPCAFSPAFTTAEYWTPFFTLCHFQPHTPPHSEKKNSTSNQFIVKPFRETPFFMRCRNLSFDVSRDFLRTRTWTQLSGTPVGRSRPSHVCLDQPTLFVDFCLWREQTHPWTQLCQTKTLSHRTYTCCS